MDEHDKRFTLGDAATRGSEPTPSVADAFRRRPAVLAPPDQTSRLLTWIDGARAATWPIERNLLILLAVIGLFALLAMRFGLLTP
jgi:hypothetical protein